MSILHRHRRTPLPVGQLPRIDADETYLRVCTLAAEVNYKRPGSWMVEVVLEPDDAGPAVRIGHFRPDVVTGEPGWGFGGRFRVAPTATDSEVVQGIFGLFKAYEEHECRESFEWKHRRIFGPHLDIQALHDIAHRTDASRTTS